MEVFDRNDLALLHVNARDPPRDTGCDLIRNRADNDRKLVQGWLPGAGRAGDDYFVLGANLESIRQSDYRLIHANPAKNGTLHAFDTHPTSTRQPAAITIRVAYWNERRALMPARDIRSAIADAVSRFEVEHSGDATADRHYWSDSRGKLESRRRGNAVQRNSNPDHVIVVSS